MSASSPPMYLCMDASHGDIEIFTVSALTGPQGLRLEQ
jgi:hypothetical protein